MGIGNVLHGLHESGIEAGVLNEVGGGGFYWWLRAMGIADTTGITRTLDDAAQAMHETALKLYPDSVYAKKAKEATPPARALTPEMMEAVEGLLSCMNLANWHDDPIAIRARAAFGIEEG